MKAQGSTSAVHADEYDSTPITESWFRREIGNGSFFRVEENLQLVCRVYGTDGQVWFELLNKAEHPYQGAPDDELLIWIFKTRGEVRRLCRLLGWEIANATTTPEE